MTKGACHLGRCAHALHYMHESSQSYAARLVGLAARRKVYVLVLMLIIFNSKNVTAEQYIEELHLQPHPEGGYYRQIYRSSEQIPLAALPGRFTGSRVFSTSIYYLLQHGDFSAFHRIKSDECWHFYAGGSLSIHVIEDDSNYYSIKIGSELQKGEVFQCVIPAEAWFAVEPAPYTQFALVGCTVAPGFDFKDFEMANKALLLKCCPQHRAIIDRLCRV